MRGKLWDDYLQEEFSRYGSEELVLREQTEESERGPWPTAERPIPKFTYTPPSGSAHLKTTVVDGGILLALTFLFGMLAFTAFLRYDVR